MLQAQQECLHRFSPRCIMTRPKLLLIDDAIHLTMLYQQEFDDDGYDVDVANTVSHAYELIKKNSYDLIIIEPMLKELKEYISALIKLHHAKEIPILINTASHFNEKARKLWFVEAIIEKSSDTSVLKEKVKSILLNNHNNNYMELYKGELCLTGIF
jgi:DNA-binding response OmpR family regulator